MTLPSFCRCNDLETKVPIRNIQYCIASCKYMTYELVSKRAWNFYARKYVLDRYRQTRMDALVMDVRYRCRYNEMMFVINFYLIWIYITCYLRVLILRLSTIVKEIYIYLVISQTVLLSLLLYNLIFIHFFFFFKLSIKQFANKKPI